MDAAGPTWIVLIREVSHAARIRGEPRVVASLALEQETGLARGMSVGRTRRMACAEAMDTALTRPAGGLAPGVPARVLCGPDDAEDVAKELARLLGEGSTPAVSEISAADEAEDIFDSFVGHLAGRRQPEEFATPPDWRLLYDQAGDYWRMQPWLRWADDAHFDLVVRADGAAARYVAVVLGQAGIQRGLVLYPGGAFPDDLVYSAPGSPVRLPAGTVLFYLDRPGESPPELRAKAARNGWPADADLVPVWVGGGPDGPADLDRTSVQRLTLAIAAVLADDQPTDPGKITGEIMLAGGVHGSYSVSLSVGTQD